jgi:hypothetical protein
MSGSGASGDRGPQHDALAVFLGEWRAEGVSYVYDQDGPDAPGIGLPWVGEQISRWHAGDYFVIQDDRARVGGEVWDTLSVLGVHPEADAYIARAFGHRGALRNYVITRTDATWRFWGEDERASIVFSDGDAKQTIVWEHKRGGLWRPLHERVAVRVD